jgi:hypothetical protein
MESGSGDAIGARPSRNNRRYPGKIKRIGNQFEMNEQSDKHSSNERATEREREYAEESSYTYIDE